MKVNVYTLNSFAKTSEGGNKAGVVLNADSLSEEEMLKIAAKVGFSETAFVSDSNLADYKVRFFTPVDEVDLCGHATIATYYTMSCLKLIKMGNYHQETKGGVLGIEVQENHFVWMNQFTPSFSELIDKREIADSLNIDVANLVPGLSPQILSTGLRDIIVPVQSVEILNSIKPDMEKVKEISRNYNAVGYHIYALESTDGANAYCRNLAPLYGIPEEAATGTSNGALACYLYHYGQVNEEEASRLTFRQGYSMNKPSEIHVSLTVKGNEILEVKVGGSAMNLEVREIEI